MWSKKEPKSEPSTERKPPVQIGDRFKYLGVDMVCTRHWMPEYDFSVVAASYVNGAGEVVSVIFPPADWTALEKEVGR